MLVYENLQVPLRVVTHLNLRSIRFIHNTKNSDNENDLAKNVNNTVHTYIYMRTAFNNIARSKRSIVYSKYTSLNKKQAFSSSN